MSGGYVSRVNVGWVGVGLVVLALAILLSPFVPDVPRATLFLFENAVTYLLFGLLILGLNLHYGWAGLINFGHVVFFAVGSYTAALLTVQDPLTGVGLGLPWPVGVGGGVLAAVVVGALLGVSTLRLRGDFLAVVTLASAEIFNQVVISLEGITGGETGLLGVPQPINDLAGGNPSTVLVTTVLLLAGLLAVVYAAITRLTGSPYGRVLRAIDDDDQVTQALGKDVFSYKLNTFIYGAAIAGFAGTLHAMYIGAVSPAFYTVEVTVVLWIGMLLAGAGNNRAVLGGLAVVELVRIGTRFLNDTFPGAAYQFASFRFIVLGVLLVAVIRYKPEGIWGDADRQGVGTE